MHAVGVTHRDVKLENIFLDEHGAVKLGDFDLAVFHHEAQVRMAVGELGLSQACIVACVVVVNAFSLTISWLLSAQKGAT